MPISLKCKVDNLVRKGLLSVGEGNIINDALEKQQCKPVIDNKEELWFMCPTCGGYVIPYHRGTIYHCHCGQSLSWEGIDHA